MTQCQNDPSTRQIAAVLEELDVSPRSDLIAVLQDVQEQLGYLPGEASEQVSRRMRVPLSRIHGVISFYSQFYTTPRGKHTIRVCRGTACHVKGVERVIDTIQRTLDIGEGESTADRRFCLEVVACLGTCFLAPVIMIDNEYFGNLTPQGVDTILKNF